MEGICTETRICAKFLPLFGQVKVAQVINGDLLVCETVGIYMMEMSVYIRGCISKKYERQSQYLHS